MSKSRSPITTHILDLNQGKPAIGVAVVLEKSSGKSNWSELASGKTNEDGRIEDLLEVGSKAEAGIYRLRFDTAAYFKSMKSTTFFPEVTICFEITNPAAHHHVPLLLNSHGFSTYRGT
ncbi:MAG: hydroxyisourate hydrolase [Bdellovibrionales bacterium]|nr:hydroxyisourate hydrolase [Bdellovibrionales bacterium]